MSQGSIIISPLPNPFLRALDYFFLLRPTQFFPLWTTVLAGYILSLNLPIFSFPMFPIMAFTMLTLNYAGIFVLNQIVDRETDRINNKCFIVSHEMISLWSAWVIGIGITTIPLVWALMNSKPLLWVMISWTVAGVLYNFVGFMNQPVLGALTNGWLGFTSFFGGVYLNPEFQGPSAGLVFLYAAPYGLAWLAVHFLVTIPDATGDKKSQKNTFAVRYGMKATAAAAFVTDAICLLISLSIQEWIVGSVALISLPFFFIAYKAKTSEKIFLPVKLSIILLSLGVMLFIPLYALGFILIYFLSKFYYKKRLNLNYPSLKP
ncbi:MAG: UbiA family prenyltransferase [Chloroherpetonaceae bacterium]|nr:UbiA family prenyltransferase [Chloroherpetonaceae bacterium]